MEDIAHYRSSVPLMLRKLLWVGLAIAMAATLSSLLVFRSEQATLVFVAAAVVFLPVAVYVLRTGVVEVTVSYTEVAIDKPGKPSVVFDRNRYQFSSTVETNSVNLIPVSTKRVLRAFDDNSHQEVVLSNLSKKSFDRLIASLRARPLAQEAGKRDLADESFPVPKEAMLADFRRLITILAAVGLAACVGLIVFLAYKLPASATANGNSIILTLAGGLVFMFVCFAIPVGMEYHKRRSRVPAIVSLADGHLIFDDDRLSLAEVRRIIATPPEYGMSDWSNMRRMTVESDRGKKVYQFGVRKAGGVWKTEFAGYGAMCQAIETVAAQCGFAFIYDL